MSKLKSKRAIAFLAVYLAMLSISIPYAASEDGYFNDVHLFTQIFKDIRVENGYKAAIVINPSTTAVDIEENGWHLDLAISQHGLSGAFIESEYRLQLFPEKAFPVFSDISLAYVTPSKLVVGHGYPVTIRVKADIEGYYHETLNVTVFANTTAIQSQFLPLTGANSETFTFTWNTRGFPKGYYTIKSTAGAMPGEMDLSNNVVHAPSVVQVTIQGDVDGNGVVDIFDLTFVGKAYGSFSNTPHYYSNVDINEDGVIDARDLAVVTFNWGESAP